MDATSKVFVRLMLKTAMAEVKKKFDATTRKAAWTCDMGLGCWEFHINKCPQLPEGFYWYGSASGAYEARAVGWTRLLDWIGGGEGRYVGKSKAAR